MELLSLSSTFICGSRCRDPAIAAGARTTAAISPIKTVAERTGEVKTRPSVPPVSRDSQMAA